jgi:hypothetical protein
MRTKLSDKEFQTKKDLIQTGRFDAAGEKYERTRKLFFSYFSFSELFKKKEKDMQLNMSLTA